MKSEQREMKMEQVQRGLSMLAQARDPNIQTIDLASVRESASSPYPPCDVKFTFVDKDTGEKAEIPAHMFILSCGSPVFNAQFYGTMKDEKESIVVEDVTLDAFKIFLDTLYNKEVSLSGLDFHILAELFYLANKHHLDLMKDSIIDEVSSRKVVSGQVVEAAKVAENNVHLERFSDSLYSICSMFVKNNPGSVLEIFNSEEIGEENSCTLHRLMARAYRTQPIPPTQTCENCKENPCLHGEMLTKDNFVVGAKIYHDAVDVEGFIEDSRIATGLVGTRVHYSVGFGEDYICLESTSNIKLA